MNDRLTFVVFCCQVWEVLPGMKINRCGKCGDVPDGMVEATFEGTCVECGVGTYYAPGLWATAPGHTYSELGVREFQISRLCEWCFDKITDIGDEEGFEEDYSYELEPSWVEDEEESWQRNS